MLRYEGFFQRLVSFLELFLAFVFFDFIEKLRERPDLKAGDRVILQDGFKAGGKHLSSIYPLSWSIL